MAKAKRNLDAGDEFNLAGYEPMAMIDSMEGRKIVVVSNNSSHFLVAVQTQEDWEASTRTCNMATLLESFPYVPDEEPLIGDEDVRLRQSYMFALTAAVKHAMAR